MAELICKYCGKEVKSNNGSALTVPAGNSTCNASPMKKHILLPTGKNCVFCGMVVKSNGSSLVVPGGTSTCSVSPTKKHQLGE